MTKDATSAVEPEGTTAPDLDVVKDVQLERGEVLIWPSPHGRVFGFIPVNMPN